MSPCPNKKIRTQKRNHLHQSALPFRVLNLYQNHSEIPQPLWVSIPWWTITPTSHSREGCTAFRLVELVLVHIEWYKRSEVSNWNTCWFQESELVLKSSCHLYSNQHPATSHEPDKNHPKEQVADNRKCQVHTCTWSAQKKRQTLPSLSSPLISSSPSPRRPPWSLPVPSPPARGNLYCIEGS